MSATNTRTTVRTTDELITIGGASLLGLLGVAYVLLLVGNALSGQPTDQLLGRALRGEITWTPTHTTVALTTLGVVAVAAPLLWWADVALYGPRRPITRTAKYCATVWQARKLMGFWRSREVRRKGGSYTMPMIGYLGRTARKLYFGPEDTGLVITGPRENKSSSIANPFIVEAPGAVLATSNKPDVVTDTMGLRASRGPCFIYDPQNLYHGPNPAPMYWDPLGYIRDVPAANMVEQAAKLARRFLFAAGGPSKSDPHWGNAATAIMSAMFVAAAIDHRPITDVYRWILAPSDTTPVNILEADGRFSLTARSLDEYAHHPERTRAGEYGNAQTALAFLSYDTVVPWVTPTPGRVAFRPEMMTAGDAATLYVLSQEGETSATALTAALTIAVSEAAVEAANRNGGRLDTPMFLVLDEVANVCRWEALPDLYTHFGSKGILPIALLQNYSQGKHVWGEDRMKQLLSVVSVFITGGNVKDNGFHESVVNMGPSYKRRTVSESHGKSGRSTSTSETKEKVWDVADLRELPKEYSLMFVANTPAIILRHVPMWKRRYQKAKATPVVSGERAMTLGQALRGTRPEPAPVTAPTPTTRPRTSGWATTLTVEEGDR